MTPVVAFASLPLRLKLALGFIASTILVLVISVFAASQYTQAVQPAAGTVLQVLARERAATLTAFIDHTTSTMAGLFNDPAVVDAATAVSGDAQNSTARQTLEAAFHNVVNANPLFQQVRLISLTGDVLVAVPSTIRATANLSKTALEALQTRTPAQRASDVYVDTFGTQAGAPLNVAAVVGKGGRSAGFIVGVIDLAGSAAPAQPSIDHALETVSPSTGIVHFYVIDKSGNMYTPEIPPTVRTKAVTDRAMLLAAGPFTEAIQYVSPLRFGPALGYGVPVDQLHVTLIAETQQFQLGGSNETGQFALRLLALLVIGAIVLIVIALYLEITVAAPTRRLLRLATSFLQGRIPEKIPPLRQRDEVGNLYNAFGTLTSQVRQDIESLETRVAQRTRDVEATRDIGRIISSIRDLDALLRQVIDLIRERFENVYHAQIFLTDASGEYAVLRVSTGDIGQQLLARGHRLAVGSQSVIGQVMSEGQPVVAMDTSTSLIHKANELLPNTRAEMALPLRTSEGVIGALDLQSERPDAFSSADINLFQSIADHLSIAITNARLFEELHTRVDEIEALNRQLTGEAWGRYTRTRRRPLLAVSTRSGEDEGWSEMQRQALATRQIAERSDETSVTVAVPVSLRGEVLGVVEWDIPQGSYDEEARQLTRELADRLAISADNARLFEQAQRLAEREALVNEIASRLTQQSNVAQILQTAVREVGQALHVPQTSIRLAIRQKEEVDNPSR